MMYRNDSVFQAKCNNVKYDKDLQSSNEIILNRMIEWSWNMKSPWLLVDKLIDEVCHIAKIRTVTYHWSQMDTKLYRKNFTIFLFTRECWISWIEKLSCTHTSTHTQRAVCSACNFTTHPTIIAKLNIAEYGWVGDVVTCHALLPSSETIIAPHCEKTTVELLETVNQIWWLCALEFMYSAQNFKRHYNSWICCC